MGTGNRQRNILEFTLSSLLRRRWRNAALILVYTAVIFVLASVMFFTYAIREEAAVLLREAPEIVVQRMVAGRYDLIPVEYIEAAEGIRGVSSVEGRLWGYYYDPASGATYTLMVPADKSGISISSGDIVIGNGIARIRNAEKGDIMSFRTYRGDPLGLRITDVLSLESELLSSDLILLSAADFRALFGISDGYVTDIAVSARNPREFVTIANKIVDRLPDTRPILREEILRTYDAVFNWRGGVMVAVLAGAVLAFIIFAWDRASGLSAEERREIGILKAIGWETSDVILMKFWEGTVISLSSFLMGVILAYIHVFFASSAFFEPVLKGWSVLYPEFRLVPAVDFFQLSTLFFLTVVPYTITTIVPSWRAATVDPDSVMRE